MNNSQRGNALWFILIAIALLALLTVALSRGSSNNNDSGSFERNQISATSLINDAKEIQNGVQFLLSKGCGENQISFDSDAVDDYENTNAPDDKSCHIFEPEGMGLTYNNETALIDGAMNIDGTETTAADLVYYLPNITLNQCNAINRVTGAPSGLDDTFEPAAKFTGSFTSSGTVGDADEFENATAGCFQSTGSSAYHFFYILYAR